LIESGARVVVIACDTGRKPEVEALGAEFVDLDLGRESIGPLVAARTMFQLRQELKRLDPRTVFLIATAAYVLGSLSALTLPRTRFIIGVTGSGRALSSSKASATVVGWALAALSRRRNTRLLFQLHADRAFFVDRGWAVRGRSHVIAGTGIDAKAWHVERLERDSVTVLFAARLFREKGAHDFVSIAQRLQAPNVRFVLAGAPDAGVASTVTQKELDQWAETGAVEIVGRQHDMPRLLASADILVAPSSHPEGTPKALIEAAASGLAIVAYDQVGVRAVLDNGRAGAIVKSNDLIALESAVRQLINDRSARETMAYRAHEHAVRQFDIDRVLQRLYAVAFDEETT